MGLEKSKTEPTGLLCLHDGRQISVERILYRDVKPAGGQSPQTMN